MLNFPLPIRPRLAHQLLLVSLLVLLVGCGLSSEPEIIGQLPTATRAATLPSDAGFPAVAVDIARGATLYAANCAPCHGASGEGDGPAAASFSCPMPQLADAAAHRDASLSEWFAVVSHGNGGTPDCLMPPWNGRLNEQQRWDVTSYAYGLQYGFAEGAEVLAQGAGVWAEHCAGCHGESGTGDGPQATADPSLLAAPADLTAPIALLDQSDAALWRLVTEGRLLGADASGASTEEPPAPARHPAFADTLTESQRWAVVAYARALSWQGLDALAGLPSSGAPAAAGADTVAPTGEAGTPATMAAEAAATAVAAVPEEPTLSGTFTVRGSLTAGTPGLSIPAGQAVTLRVIERADAGPREFASYDTTAAEDGTFSFTEVPRREELVYVAVTTYEGVVQFSELGLAVPEPSLELPLPLYTTTEDASVVSIEVQQVFVDFTAPGQAFIQVGMRLRNIGDRIYTSAPASDEAGSARVARPMGVEIPLPVSAGSVTVESDLAQLYQLRGPVDALVLVGTAPLMPGDTQVFQGSFELSFTDSLVYTARTQYAVEALAVHLPQAEGVEVADRRFGRGDPLTLGSGVYETFVLDGALPAGAEVRFTVNAGPWAAGNNTATLLLLALGALAILGGAGVVFWRLRRGAAPEPDASPETALIREIVDLDRRHEAGLVPDEEYAAERQRLKVELARALAGSHKDD